MILKRKAYQQLLAWKNSSQGRTSLLVEGARRVGKSHLVRSFAENEYVSHLIIDFSIAPQQVLDIFETKRHDIEEFFFLLTAYYQVSLHERNSVIVFDEVQHYPTARAFLKQLVEDGRYDFIATGSLLSIRQNVQDILIPSEERSLVLHPFDFEEFLEAIGRDQLVSFIRPAAERKTPIPLAIHQLCMENFRKYLLVGGMPQAIIAFIETQDFGEVDQVKREILRLYRSDVGKYAGSDAAKVRAVFDQIPSQLSKQNKRFVLASIDEDARMRGYEDSFFWLQDARIANACYNSTDPRTGLALSLDSPTFKLYLADTGLLVSQVMADRARTSSDIYHGILFDRLSLNEGMLVENVIAQMLAAAGHSLYYYARSSRERSEDRMELDFLIVPTNTRGKISPIEVKSTSRYRTKSLDKFREKFGKRVGTEYVLHPGNIRIEGNREYLPLYLAPYL